MRRAARAAAGRPTIVVATGHAGARDGARSAAAGLHEPHRQRDQVHAAPRRSRRDRARSRTGTRIGFAVSDNGPGIAPQYRERIWQIFQTLAPRDKVEGTGIGLSVVRKIVESRGGRAWLESEPGDGNDLPLHLAHAARRSTVTAPTRERLLNILLVEDDEVDVMNVRRAFQKNHITNPLFVAANGVEALELLRGGTIPRDRRIVLLDLNMPQMNGIEFLRELRRDPELTSTPVVVLTTSNDERDRIEAYNLNVAGYLLKPVTFSNFCEVMATLNKYWALVELP